MPKGLISTRLVILVRASLGLSTIQSKPGLSGQIEGQSLGQSGLIRIRVWAGPVHEHPLVGSLSD